MENPPVIIQDFNGFKVVRDDLFEGGTKRRAFNSIVKDIVEDELVYSCDYYGAAAYAISLVAKEVGKNVMLFYLSPKHDTDLFNKAISLPNVKYEIVEGAGTQIEASKRAKEYS